MLSTHFSSQACFPYDTLVAYQVIPHNPTTNSEMGALSNQLQLQEPIMLIRNQRLNAPRKDRGFDNEHELVYVIGAS